MKNILHQIYNTSNFHDVSKYKFIHIMNNGIHTFSILHFINKYFDNTEHCFIFPNPREETEREISKFPNALKCPMDEINISNTEKIVFHGLFTKTVIDFLRENDFWLEKSYWYIWGGDLYGQHNKEDKHVYSNFAGILTAFDKDIYEHKFGKCSKYFDVTYPHRQHELNVKQKIKNNFIHIQVNNCEDETTIEMLEVLSKFKDENIKISTILSYKSHGHKHVSDIIMQKGFSIFKQKFNPIIEYMPIEKYSQHLASVDVYISNQNRQQGNGNASLVCSLGNKVYIKSDTSVYNKYKKLGIVYYDTYTIKDLSFEEFIFQDANIKEQSMNRLKHRMQDSTKIMQWKCFFNSKS